MTWDPRALRVRRYVDGELESEYALLPEDDGFAGEADGEWSIAQSAAGRHWYITVDDPNRDTDVAVVLMGPEVE
jgi:hypothetical protein